MKGDREEAGGYNFTKPLQLTTQSIRAAVPASGGKTATIWKHYKTLSLLCHPDKGDRGDLCKSILQAQKIMEHGKARIFFDKYGIEKTEECLN